MFSEKILVVDDEDTNRFLIATLLESFGFVVVQASGVEVATVIFSENPNSFSLVFTDYDMLDGDGFVLLNRIREVSDVPVVLISGSTAISKEKIDRSFSGFFAKPLKIAIFLAYLQEFVLSLKQ